MRHSFQPAPPMPDPRVSRPKAEAGRPNAQRDGAAEAFRVPHTPGDTHASPVETHKPWKPITEEALKKQHVRFSVPICTGKYRAKCTLGKGVKRGKELEKLLLWIGRSQYFCSDDPDDVRPEEN